MCGLLPEAQSDMKKLDKALALKALGDKAFC